MSDSEQNISLLSAMICDDIRPELSGKQTVVGVYPDYITPKKFPFNTRVALFIRFHFKKKGAYQIEYRFRNDTESVISASGRQKIESKRDDAVAFGGMISIPIKMDEPDTLTFEYQIEEEEGWSTMVILRITEPHDDVTIASASEQPSSQSQNDASEKA